VEASNKTNKKKNKKNGKRIEKAIITGEDRE
jgi:hypothetical protein